jgi:excisionase family DNA binding protein
VDWHYRKKGWEGLSMKQKNSIELGISLNGQAGPTDGFISKADVAARLGKTARTVEQWMQRGVIPYIKIGKGRRATVLFKWADIEAHLKSNFGVGFDFDM